MEKIVDTILKLLFSSIFIGAGIWLPTIVSQEQVLECSRDRQQVNCRIQLKAGGILLSKGPKKLLDTTFYDDVRQAEVATVYGGSPDIVVVNNQTEFRSRDLARLVLVFRVGKQGIPMQGDRNPALAASIASQINLLVKQPQAPQVSTRISGTPQALPNIVGFACIGIGVLMLFLKAGRPAEPNSDWLNLRIRELS